MELRELRYFLAVANKESISRAAKELFVTQPNLSRQMKKLEEETGRQLFVRGSRKITLTEAGKLLKKRAWPAPRRRETWLSSRRVPSSSM